MIDRKRGMQHIFIFSGHPIGPAGVFRITRTLDTPKLVAFFGPLQDSKRQRTVSWLGGGESNRWHDPTNWDRGVPEKQDTAVFENTNRESPVFIEGVAELGRIFVRLPRESDRITLAGSGTLVLHGAETGVPNKYAAGLIQTGILDFGPDLGVDIRNQRLIAGNRDGTIVIRSNKVRAGKKAPTSNDFPSDGKDLKLGITDRGRFLLATRHWEPRMSLDMSASHTVGPKIFEFALTEGSRGVTFTRLKEHDADAVEIRGFDADDFFRFGEDPFQSCDKGKEFRIQAVKFIGWTKDGAAKVEENNGFWYLKPLGQPQPSGSSVR